AAAASNGSPLWNLTPDCSSNSQVLSSTFFHDLASSGLSARSVSPSWTCWPMFRPTALRSTFGSNDSASTVWMITTRPPGAAPPGAAAAAGFVASAGLVAWAGLAAAAGAVVAAGAGALVAAGAAAGLVGSVLALAGVAGFGASVGLAGAWVGAGVGAGAEQAASSAATPIA